MTRNEILDKAKQCVTGDRDHDYGGPERSFDCIAKMWEAYLEYSKQVEIGIAPADVAAMMAMLKLARIAKSPEKDDSWIDLAGYAACGGECIARHNDEVERNTLIKRWKAVCSKQNLCSACPYGNDPVMYKLCAKPLAEVTTDEMRKCVEHMEAKERLAM